jgi:hypothetical protein
MKAEETIFLLSNENNYYLKIKSHYEDIVKSFCNLINFYFSFSMENMNIKDKDIFFAGLNVIQHIFRIIFLYTKNLELTFYNTQQAIYFYVEYISQITDRDDNIFFNLSIKDAVIYVYTRSIFEIRKQYVKKNCDNDTAILNNLVICTNNYMSIIELSSVYLFEMNRDTVKQNLIHILENFMRSNKKNKLFDTFQSNSFDDILMFLQE